MGKDLQALCRGYHKGGTDYDRKARLDSVLLQTEIPTLIDGITQNNSLTSVNGISADTLRDIYHDANVTDKKQALSNIMLLSGSKHTRLTLSPKLEAKQYGYRLKVELL